MKRLELLDYGRLFAAISVVAFHYTFNGIVNGKISSISHIPSVIEITKYGYLGVELFFMISGYVIFSSARNRTAAKFAKNRAIRLYPVYWFAILFTSIFAMQWGGDLMSVYPSQIVANFSMLQSFAGIRHVDGVYWTLVYEITFYFAVFLLLFLGLQKHLHSIFIYWPVLFCMALVLEVQSFPLLGGYYYYFSAGSLFAVLAEKMDWRAVLGLLVSYVLCVYFSAGKAYQMAESKGVEYSPLIIGLVVTFYFYLFAYQNTNQAQSLKLPMSRTAGALTYPIYLIHAHFGYMFISRFATEENKIAIYILTASIVFVVAYLMHLVVEKRLHYIWKSLFGITLEKPLSYIQELPEQIRLAYKNRTN